MQYSKLSLSTEEEQMKQLLMLAFVFTSLAQAQINQTSVWGTSADAFRQQETMRGATPARTLNCILDSTENQLPTFHNGVCTPKAIAEQQEGVNSKPDLFTPATKTVAYTNGTRTDYRIFSIFKIPIRGIHLLAILTKDKYGLTFGVGYAK